MLPISGLLRWVIAPLLPMAARKLEDDISNQAILLRMNGMGVEAADFVNVLENLTGRSDLSHLTMMPFSKLISPRDLMFSTRKWCPCCIEQQRATSQPIYFPLQWSLQTANRCAVHDEPLVWTCPNCKSASPVIAARSINGYCHRCNAWLGVAFNRKPRLAQVINNNFFVRLFEWQKTIGSEREMTTFQSLIAYVMGNKLKKPDITLLAGKLCLPVSMVHDSQAGTTLPILSVVLRVSEVFEMDPMDVLTVSGKEMARRDADTITGINFLAFMPTRVNWPQLHCLLKDVASGKASLMRVEDIARVHRCCVSSVHKQYPDLCWAISAQNAQHLIDVRAVEKARIKARIKEIVEDCGEKGTN